MARQGWGRHSTVATGSDSGDQVSVNAWNADTNKAGMLGFTGETVASATSITPTNSTIILSGSTNVSTIAQGNSAEYDLLYVFTSGSVTLVNTSSPSSAGDIKLLANANKDLSTTVPTILIRKGTAWYEYGGGITNSLNDIGDVVITSVANEDVLAYDSTTSKWINQSADETGRVTASSTTTFTNKTIDQDGTGNSITNIANASIKASAAIDATKIADGSVTSAEFQYINTLSSNAQTQLDAKSPSAGSSSIVTVGALDSGSITSGFGNINIGSSTFTTTGAVATGAITAGGTITGNLTGNVTGDVSGSSGSTTGNAATATALATARTIGGTSFDGTANIAVALSAEATTLATGRTISTTGEVTVTTGAFDGSAAVTGAAVVADNVIDEANLKASNAPTNGYVLTARSGNTGGMTWEASSGGAVELGQYKYQANGYTEPSYSSRTVNDATTPVELWVKDIDGSGNNQAVYIRIKKNGSYTNVQVA